MPFKIFSIFAPNVRTHIIFSIKLRFVELQDAISSMFLFEKIGMGLFVKDGRGSIVLAHAWAWAQCSYWCDFQVDGWRKRQVPGLEPDNFPRRANSTTYLEN